MRCKHCDAPLAAHDFWCSNCGKQSQVVTKDLSSWKSLSKTWTKYLPARGLNIPAAAFSIIAGMIPMAAVLAVMYFFGRLDFSQEQSTPSLLLNLFILAGGMAVFFPILLIPFPAVYRAEGHSLSFKEILDSMKNYPRQFLLSLFTVLWFVVIYLICFGLPKFGSDPILRLVWLVLVNYFWAVFLPVPILMERLKQKPLQAFKTAYKHFHVARWQLWRLALILIFLNLLGVALAFIPLIFTLPLSWFAIRDYTDLLLEYEIIRSQK